MTLKKIPETSQDELLEQMDNRMDLAARAKAARQGRESWHKLRSE